MQNDPTIQELIESAKDVFPLVDNWNELKNDIISHIANMTTKSFRLTRRDNVKIDVKSFLLSDGSLMVVNNVVQDNE